MTSPDLVAQLERYGADLTRWPDRQNAAREALLADPEFRAAFESERALDRGLAAERDARDEAIARAGAVGRVRQAVLAQTPANVLAGLPWPRIAAAILVAGMLGGAVDLMLLPPPPDDPIEVAIADPLYNLPGAGSQ